MSSSKTFTPAQLAWINRKSKPKPHDPADGGELNIIPFLDIIMNILIFVLASVTSVFTATIPMPAPSSGPGGGGGNSNEVNITLKITREGFIVGAQGGFLQPGCTTIGPATITVPLVERERRLVHDFAGLNRCMVAIRNHPQWRAELAENHKIQIAANQDIPYSVLIGTLDAVRETRPGAKDMFTEPTLGILN
jgi:biopolymer transport protein ExbD